MTPLPTEPAGILLDPERQAEFESLGYTVVPFLTAEEVQGLLEGYAALVPEPDESVIAFDFTRDDRRVMDGVARLLQPVFDRVVPRHFVDHEAVFWTFVIKPAGPHSEMGLHDDRTYVDESRSRACTVWVPLVDTSPELDNGYLCVVPGSHTILPVASGTNVPNWFEPYYQYFIEHGVPVSVPAGSALIYDSKTLHYSPPNRSDRVRPAIAAAVVPAGEQLVHVVADGLNRRLVYAVDEQFYVDYHPTAVEQGMPEGYELLREYWEERVSASPEEVARAIGADDLPVPTGEVTAWVPREYRPGEPEATGDAGDADAAPADAEDPVDAPRTNVDPENTIEGRDEGERRSRGLRSRLRALLHR